jgi:hypothetical protein
VCCSSGQEGLLILKIRDTRLREHIMPFQKLSAGALIAIAATAIFLTVTTAGLLSVNQSVSSSGIVTSVNLGVYQEYACTNNLTSVDWGTLSPGDTATRTIYVKNIGTAPITLSMTTTNWNPASANGPITLTWNRESTTLDVGQVASATLTLSVSSSISGITTFNMDVVITGTG